MRGGRRHAAPRGRLVLVVGALLGALLVAGRPAGAQAEKKQGPWKRNLELSGSVFVGNRPQTVLTTRGRLSHSDSTFELGGDLRFTYGELSEDGERAVSQRSWLGTANLDLWPHARQSPFLLGTVETSLERRIDLRVSGGIGHKVTFVDEKGASANLSVALLGERSRLPNAEGIIQVEKLARFSTRLRLSRQVGSRATLSLESFYRPEYSELDQYTFANTSSVGYKVNDVLNLKLTYQDNYDSEARGRGAESNYDGQLVVGIAAAF